MRTKLNQTGTFISKYKQVQFIFDNSKPSSINKKNWNYEKNLPNASVVVNTMILKITCSVTAF